MGPHEVQGLHYVLLLARLGVLLAIALLITSTRSSRATLALIRARIAVGAKLPVVASALIAAQLALVLLIAAVTPTATTDSPLNTIPFAGKVLGELNHAQQLHRLLVAVLALSACVVMAAAADGFVRLKPWTSLALVWLLLTGLLTHANDASVLSIDLTDFWFAWLISLSVVLLVTVADSEVLLALTATVMAGFLLVNLWILVAHPSFGNTTLWPGGFQSGPRFQGTMPQPNVMGLMAAASLVVLAVPQWTRLIRWPLAVLGAVLIWKSGSRDAVALLVLLPIVCWRLKRRPHRARAMAALAWVASLSAVLVISRAAHLLNGRGTSWNEARELASRSIWVGSGNFTDHSGLYAVGLYAHNQLLQTLVEAGVLGLGLLIVATFLSLPRQVSGSTQRIVTACALLTVAVFSFENPIRVYSLIFLPTMLMWPILASIASGLSPWDEDDDPGAEPLENQLVPGRDGYWVSASR